MKIAFLPRVMRLLVLSIVFLFAGNITKAADYYWKGGTGLWTDLTHWVTTSGGSTNHTIVPTAIDNVIFDGNSFTGAGTVTINFQAFCNNFTVTSGVGSGVTFQFNSGLIAGGSISATPSANLVWNQSSALQAANGVTMSRITYTMSTGNIAISGGNLNLNTNTQFTYNANSSFSHTLSGTSSTIILDGTSKYLHGSNATLNVNGPITVPSGATFNVTANAQKNLNKGGFEMQSGSIGTLTGNWNIINGGFKLHPGGTISYNGGAIYMQSTVAGTHYIQCGGRNIRRVELNGSNVNAEYRLLDKLIALNDGFFPYANKFITDGHQVNVDHFYAWSSTTLTVDLTGTDSVFLMREFRMYPSTTATLIPGTCTIVWTGAQHQYFYGGNKKYHDLVFNSSSTGDIQIYLEYNDTLRDVHVNGQGRQYLRWNGNKVVRNVYVNHLNAATNSSGMPTMDFNGNNIITGEFKYTAVGVNMRPVWNFSSTNTINTLQWVTPVSEWVLGGTQTIADLKPIVGSCSKTMLIRSNSVGLQRTISQASGTVTGDWLLLQDIRGFGGATFTATNTINLGNNSGWIITPIPPQKFYWIGKNGNTFWNDPNNWSLSSGGPAGCAIPSRIDSVFFDANSFTAAGQFCNVNIAAECKNMTWDNIVTGAGMNGSNTLSIYGSLKLDAPMTYSMGGQLIFQSMVTGNTIETEGETILGSINIQCQQNNAGEYTLLDNLKCNGTLTLTYGKFFSGGKDLDVFSFVQNSGQPTLANFTGTALIKIQNQWWSWHNTTLVMPSTTELRFEATNHFTFYSYGVNSGNKKNYGKIVMNSLGTAGYDLYMHGYYNNIPNMKITYAGNYRVSNEIYYSTWDSLDVNFNYPTYNIDARFDMYGQYDTINHLVVKSTNVVRPKLNTPYYFKVNNFFAKDLSEWITWPNTGTMSTYGNITLQGSCTPKMIVRNTTSGSNQAIINCTGTATADNCILKDIKIQGGGTYTATNTGSNGNTTGWTGIGTGTDYYWVGGTGNWNDGNRWSFSPGGAASGCIPSEIDNVFFNANSFTAANQTVTVNVLAKCRNMHWGTVNNPIFAGNQQLEIFGSMTIAPNVTWNHTGWTMFNSRTTGNTIKTGNRRLWQVQFLADNTQLGGWTLQDSLWVLNDIYFRAGNFVSNGHNVTARSLYNDINSNLITLNYTGTKEIKVNQTFQVQSSTNLVIDTATVKFIYNGNHMQFEGGSKVYKNVDFTIASQPNVNMFGSNTYNNVSFTNSGWPIVNIYDNSTYNDISFVNTNATTNIPTVAFNGTNNINSLSVNSTGNGGPWLTLNQNNTFNSLIAAGLGTRLYLGANRTQTVNSVLALGNGSFPVLVQSTTAGVQGIIYKPSGLVCLDYVVMKDTKGDGLPNGMGGIQTQFFAGASSVSISNNTNWLFSSCDAYYWVGGTGNWSDAANHWATTSGGTTFHSAPPGSDDNVFFDANSFTLGGQTVTINVPTATCKNMRWASAAFNPTFAGTADVDIYGDLELITGMNQNVNGNWNFKANDTAGRSLNPAGKTMTNVNFIGGTSGIGKWTLQNLMVVSNNLNFDNGTLNTNNKNINTKNFNSTTSNTRSLQLGSSVITLTNGTWDVSTLSNATLIEGTSTIFMAGATGTFNGNNLTYNNLTFDGTPGIIASLTGTNSFNVIKLADATNLSVSASSTQTMNNLIANGTCGNPIFLQSTTSGTQATFTKASGTVNTTFMNIMDMKAQGGATYNASYSANLGNNTGWNFTSSPTVIDAILASTYVSCTSNNNGTATVDSIIGGIAPYTFLWSNSLTTRTITNLVPGTYSVTITDSAGCTVTKSINVTNTPSTITAVPFTASSLNVCQNTAINFTAGTPAQSVAAYRWDFGDFTTSNLQNPPKSYPSPGGTYTVTLSYLDTNGCPANTSAIVKVSYVAQSIVQTNVLCRGDNNGTITVTANNGVPPYLYSKDNGATYQSSNTFTGLAPATYQVKVKDSINCTTSTQNVTITQPGTVLSFTSSTAGASCAGNNNGSITITASGGTPPYNYSVNNGILFVTSNMFTNLSAGTYNVIVRDANACVTAVQNITVGVSDNVLPTITCPSNITLTGTGGCTENVTISAPTTGDNCGVASVTNNFNNTANASGSYPVGTTSVIWTVVDVNNNSATCTMTVTVTGPEIGVTGNSTNIADGDATPSTADYTDFGSVQLGQNLTRVYSIKNNGTTTLTINSISITGTNASEFTYTSSSLPANIAAGNTLTLNVTFTPGGLGSRPAKVEIGSTDCDESTFDFAIQGTGACATPTAYNITGGGAYCAGGAGMPIGLSNSQTGVNYQLMLGASPVGSPLAGTGTAITFGNQSTGGNYTVVATNTVGNCTNNMTGSVLITVNPLPTAFTVTGGGAYCAGGAGVNVNLSGSQTGVSYQLMLGASASGSPVNGNGGSISFGNRTAVGTYTVVATNASTNCVNNMTGSVAITVNPLPTAFNVTGAGSYCSGGSGVVVGLDGSETGINYQLKLGASNIGSPVAGTGSAISFGNQTTGGTYTVVATNTTTNCTSNMTGSATVTVNPNPTVYNVTGGGSYCSGGIGVPIGLSGSQTGISYQLIRNGSINAGSPVAGTGSAISFGNHDTAGTYNVMATNITTNCTANMAGSVTVTVNPLPIITPTSDQILCANNSTSAITFNSNISGSTFNWVNNTSSIGLAASGSGNLPSFTALNTGATPVTAIVVVTPTSPGTGGGGNGLAYIANYSSGTVTVVNTATNAVVTTVGVGSGPYAVGVTPDGSRVYIANRNSSNVSVINTATNTVSATITGLGSTPTGIAIAPDGSKAYVTNEGSNSVSVINTATNTVTGTIGVGNCPRGIAISPDGSRVYTANVCTTTVSVINTSTNTVIATVTAGTGPNDVTVTPDGSKAYVANVNTNTVSVINTSTNAVSATVTVGNSPWSVMRSPDGSKVYVSNQSSNTVSVINTSTNTVSATISGSFSCPGGMSFAANGTDLMVTNVCASNVVKLNTTTNTVTSTASTGSSPYSVGHFIQSGGAGCTGPSDTFTITVNPRPFVYNVTGGGAYCAGGSGMLVGLSNSQANVNYQLMLGASPVGNPVAGTGSSISFGNQATAGTYTVVATHTMGSCTANMNGSATVSINPLPTASVGGTKTICNGSATNITFSGTANATVTYDVNGGGNQTITLNSSGTATLNVSPVVNSTYTIISVTSAANCTSIITGQSAVVTVNYAPVFTACPTNISVNTDPNRCYALVNYTATTNGTPTPNVSYAFTGATTGSGSGTGTGATFNKGVTNVVITASNSCSTVTCNFTITVTDNEPPAIACLSNIVVNNDPGQCGAVVSYTAPVGTDNCPGQTTTQTAGRPSGSFFSVGTTTNTFEVKDANGLTAICSFDVIVTDSEHPVIACSANITVNNGNGVCGAIVTYSTPVGTDNCPAPVTTQTAGLASGATFPVGTTTNTFVVTDAYNQTATCSFTVTVNAEDISIAGNGNTITDGDNIPEAADHTDFGGTNPSVPVTRTYTIHNNGTADLDVSAINISGASASSFTAGGITLPATIAASTSTTFTVTFNETVLGIKTADVEVVSTDCDVPSYNYAIQGEITCAPASFTTCPSNINVNTISGMCDQIVTYTAITNGIPAPAITYTFSGATTGNGSGTGTGAKFNVGVTTVTINATNPCSNMNCTFTVTVVDNEAPVITCPANIAVNNDASACGAVVSYSAPTSTDNCGVASTVQTAGLASGATFPVGTTTNTFKVTDINGNTNTCSFTVTVTDNEVPSITCASNISVNNDATVCGAVVNYAAPSTTDNCGVTSTVQTAGLASGATFPVGTTTNTFVVTDVNGNTNTCSFTVTVADNEVPSIECAANVSVNNDANVCGAVVNYAAPSTTDNCGVASTVQTTGLASGAIFPVGTTTNTFVVTDVNGNTNTCSFTVTVTDNEAPSITCASNISVNNDATVCGAIVNYAAPSTTDNCGVASTVQTAGLASGATFPVGTTTNTFKVTDINGNTNTCSFTITVTDNEAPSITCASNVSVNNDASVCGAVINYATPSTSDNCGVAGMVQTAGLASGATFPVGTTTNTFVVTDVNGNTNTCSFTVTVADNEAPSITCASNISVNNDASVCGAVVNYAAPSTTDNCGVAGMVQTAGLASGATFPVGTTTNAFVVTDVNGNTNTCSFTVTVTDNEAPSITCAGNVSVNNDATVCGAVVNYATPSTTDNCGVAGTVQTAGLASGATFPVGTTTNTFVVTDVNGNTNTCSFTVTVTDNEAPSITCASNISVNNDATVCGAVVNYATPSTSDNCGIAGTVQTAGLASGATFPVGTTTNTFKVTDINGNTNTCSFTVTVADNEAPVVLTQNQTIYLDATGNASITTNNLNNNSTDNCGIQSMSLSQTAFSCSHVGANTVTLTVTDIYNNSASNTATVTVVDTVKPVISCPSNVTVSCLTKPANTGSATATDACGIDTTTYADASTYSANPADAAHYNYTISRTWTVVDNNGNSSSCTQTITVQQLNTTAQVTNVACNGGNSGSIDLSVAGGVGSLSYSWSNGATTQDVSGLIAGTYTVLVTDGAGCTQTTSYTVAEPTVLVASAISVSPNPTVAGQSMNTIYLGYGAQSVTLSSTASGGTPGYTYSWTPTTGVANATSATTSVSPVVTTTYTLTVTDAKGCIRTVSKTIYVLDVRDGNNKVKLCHNGNTISVSVNSVPSHLAHGDQLGRCFEVYATTTKVSCYGGNNGSINATVTGGVPSYTYSWSNGATTEDISGLTAGNYTLTVTAANGVVTSGTFTVSQNSKININGSVTNVKCHGESTGCINLSVSGGDDPYTYVWNDASTSKNRSNLGAGTYIVTVTDSKGCIMKDTFVITQPATPISVTSVITHVKCYGSSTGKIDITVTGGTGSYSYNWSQGNSNSDDDDDYGDDDDNNNNDDDDNGDDDNGDDDDNNNYGDDDDGGNCSTQDNVNLKAGTYTVKVKDANGCEKIVTFTILQPTAIAGTIAVNPNPTVAGQSPNTIFRGYGPQSVTLTASASGGTPGYTYSWSPTSGVGSPTSASTTVTPTNTTTYKVTITDANGCKKEVTKKIEVEDVRSSGDKIKLCHNGQNTTVSQSSVAAHLAHGDNLGSCNSGCKDCKDPKEEANQDTHQESMVSDIVVTRELKVYPNPNNGKFFVELPQEVHGGVVSIMDMSGKLIQKVNFNPSEKVQVSLVDVSNGVYMVQVLNSGIVYRALVTVKN